MLQSTRFPWKLVSEYKKGDIIIFKSLYSKSKTIISIMLSQIVLYSVTTLWKYYIRYLTLAKILVILFYIKIILLYKCNLRIFSK